MLVHVGFGLLGCQETGRDGAYLFFFFKLLFLFYSESSLDTKESGSGRFGGVLFYFINQKMLRLGEFLFIGGVQCGAKSRGLLCQLWELGCALGSKRDNCQSPETCNQGFTLSSGNNFEINLFSFQVSQVNLLCSLCFGLLG